MIGRGRHPGARIRMGERHGAAGSKWSSSSSGLTFPALQQGRKLSDVVTNPRSAPYRDFCAVDHDSDSEDIEDDSSAQGSVFHSDR
mmetsp:Transcript_12163/g.26525  ORF Transcript_12163/g.26525 Transcript_12163/m.26525 type:complete len:86 (+) Transcript_12163:119-376(+)